jgi:tripartite ATP-independent transporter DctM subunit
MAWWLIGTIMFLAFLGLLLIGIPVAFSLGSIAILSSMFLFGAQGLQLVASTAYVVSTSFVMIAVPLFIFMGEIIMESGASGDAFRAVDAWFGRVRGGTAVSTIVSTTIFGAVTGFSPASCAAIGSISIPAMLQRRYDKGLAFGSVGGGACLAILIPPSLLMIIYGSLADVSVASLFYGGIIPGLLGSALFIAYVILRTTLTPSIAPWRTQASWGEKMKLSVRLIPLLLLIILVMGTIWGGIATPTEAAAIGSFGAILILVGYKKFGAETLGHILVRTARSTGMLLILLIGANAFTQVLSYVGFTANLGKLVLAFEVSRWTILIITQLTILALGCFLDPGSMLFILTPIYAPIIVRLGFDPLWFGILLMINCELATITPPVGLNLYVLKSIGGEEVSFTDVIKGVGPFWGLHLLLMIMVMVFPQLATWLPSLRPK